jgi:hypothetical protein
VQERSFINFSPRLGTPLSLDLGSVSLGEGGKNHGKEEGSEEAGSQEGRQEDLEEEVVHFSSIVS